MGKSTRFLSGLCLLALMLLASAGVEARYVGGEPPTCCTCGTGRPCADVPGGSGVSLTEGNLGERYSGGETVRSAFGATLAFIAVYNSKQADGSHSRLDSVLGIGWTHSYNTFLFSQRGHMFRLGPDGRVTKYALGAGGTFTVTPGYFETLVKNPDGSFTLRQKDGTTYKFATVAGTPFFADGPVWRLQSITDRNNNVTTFTYAAGLLTQVTDTYGRSLTFTYNPQKKLAAVTDPPTAAYPLGRTTRFTYDASGTLLAQITDPEGKSVQYSYNVLAQLNRKVDKDGRVFTYQYNGAQKPSGITDGAGSPLFALTNPNNWATDETVLAMNLMRQYLPSTTSKTDGRSNVWRYQYNQNAYITKVTAPDGAVTSYTYDPATLQVASMTDANLHTTSYQYDDRGNLIKKTNHLLQVTSYTYQPEPAFNMMTSMTDANGRLTTYQYDARGNLTKSTNPLLGVREWTYDAHGNVLTEKDRNGNLTTYLYDAFGNPMLKTEAVGTPQQRMTGYQYDRVGNLLMLTNTRGFATRYEYDGLNRLIRVTDALGKITQTFYDGQGNRVQVIDRNGNSTTHQYDLRKRLVQTTDALSQTMKYTYDGNDNRISISDKNSHITSSQYDVQDRLVKTTDAIGNMKSMSYDGVGNKLTDTDANGHTTAYEYDALDRMVRKTDAEANLTQMFYDMSGGCPACSGPTRGSSLVTKQIDAEGKLTYFKYDGLDRLIIQNRKQTDTADVIDGDDAVTRYSYDAQGNRLTIVEPNGNMTSYGYDALNWQIRVAVKVDAVTDDVTVITYDPMSNVKTVTAPNLNVTSNTYDELDRLTQVDDLAGLVATYTYDNVGNRLSERDGNGNGTTYAYDVIYRVTDTTDALSRTTLYAYDPVGNLLTTTDREANVTTYVYDNINRRTQMTDALGNVTQYQYDGVGNLIRVIDANMHATDYVYDNINRRVKETYADTRVRTYTYDRVSNLKTRTDQKGQVTSYSYSDLHFLTKRDYPTSADDNMTYDLSGRMLTAERGGWLVNFTYDGANRVTQTIQNGQTLNYSYNIPGRTRMLTYPGGRAITEHTDPRSRLDRIDDAGSPPPVVQYSYDPGNRVLTRGYRNGATATYNYNANNWITSLDHTLGVVRIVGFNHDFDNEGNKRFEEKLADLANSQSKSEAYQYDRIYRLIDYKVGTLVGSTVPVPSTQTQYDLDPVGNWKHKITGGVTQRRAHNAVNEIQVIESPGSHESLAYDPNGNLIEDGRYRYGYDEENRLTAVQRKSDSVNVAQYQYDALSRRVQKIANPAATPGTTRYFYDEARIVEEQTPPGATQTTYVYGNYIDEVLTMDRGGTFYYHQNSLWSVEAVTNAAGIVVERYAYDAYGLPSILNAAGAAVAPNLWGTPHSAIANPWMFTDRQFDEETGLYFYRARYYDPVKGRFLQRDPLGYVAGMNLYAYVRGNPVRFVDPVGTDEIEIQATSMFYFWYYRSAARQSGGNYLVGQYRLKEPLSCDDDGIPYEREIYDKYRDPSYGSAGDVTRSLTDARCDGGKKGLRVEVTATSTYSGIRTAANAASVIGGHIAGGGLVGGGGAAAATWWLGPGAGITVTGGALVGGIVGLFTGIGHVLSDFPNWNATATLSYRVCCCCSYLFGQRFVTDQHNWSATADHSNIAMGLYQEHVDPCQKKGEYTYAYHMPLAAARQGLRAFQIDSSLGTSTTQPR